MFRDPGFVLRDPALARHIAVGQQARGYAGGGSMLGGPDMPRAQETGSRIALSTLEYMHQTTVGKRTTPTHSMISEVEPSKSDPIESGGTRRYCTTLPGRDFETARMRALAWTSSHGQQRNRIARVFMADTVNAYIAASGTDRTSITELSEFITSVESGDLEVVPASLATALGHAAANLDPVAAAYWLSSTYTSMLSDEIRSRLGIYYTPPALSERLLDMVEIAGADWRTSRVLDPACGGGAFLGPVSLRMAESLRDRSPGEIVASIAERLRGYEIDPFAAWLAQVFLEVSLDSVGLASEIGLPRLVQVCDSLQRDPESGSFDVVVGNPPYGRMRALTRCDSTARAIRTHTIHRIRRTGEQPRTAWTSSPIAT